MLDEFRSTSIAWDKATRRIYSPVTANESDSNGRKLNIQVVNSGQVENLTGATLHLYWETKDKAQYGLDAFTASDISKGEFEIFYTTGMLSNVGELNATLVLVDNTGKVVSDWFKITVARGIDNDAIQSENSFSSLTQALIDISNLEQNYTPRLNDLTAQLQQNTIEKPSITDTMSDQLVYGLLPTIVGSLTTQISAGLVYFQGKRIVKKSENKTFTAWKDTYVYINSTGIYSYIEVANGGTAPASPVGTMRIAKVVTNDAAISSVVPAMQNVNFGYGAGLDNTFGWKNTFVGYYAGRTNTEGSYNTFLGYYAGHLNLKGQQNTFIGYGSGRGNTDGNYNVFMGFESGHLNTTGYDNVAIGYHALRDNLTGFWNVALGRDAGQVNTANSNIFIGRSAGIKNTTGASNTFVGTQAGAGNLIGAECVFIGYQAGLMSTGAWNTIIGAMALSANTTGYLNTAIGRRAGNKIVTGLQNTFIGSDSGNDALQGAMVANSTAIGYGAYTTASNQIKLGNADVAVVQSHGDFETLGVGGGFICKSPNGTRYRIKVADSGALSAIAV